MLSVCDFFFCVCHFIIYIINCFENVFYISLIPENFFKSRKKNCLRTYNNQIVYLNYI